MTVPLVDQPSEAPAAAKLPSLSVVLALLAVYVIWGSTYLGMRVALETFSPFWLGAARFLLAGGLLVAFERLRGAPWPDARQWVGAAVSGSLMLSLGNGLVGVAQKTSIDSGVAATVVATMPMWMALMGAFVGDRPTRREAFGLVLAFLGVAVLHAGGSLNLGGVGGLALIGAPIGWALGSVISRRAPMPRGLMGSGVQMLAGGLTMLGVALVTGERLPHEVDARVLSAVGYLVVFGSLLGFTAYRHLLEHTRPALASSYAYVNPVVALVLGAVLAGEPLSSGRLFACAIIVAGVVVVVRRPRARA